MSIITFIDMIGAIIAIICAIVTCWNPTQKIYKKIKYKQIYKKSDILKKEFYSSEFLFESIPQNYCISIDDLNKMIELKLCDVFSHSNIQNKYKMVI